MKKYSLIPNRIRIIALLLCICSFALFTLPAFAKEDDAKVVRVGYVDVKGYEEGGEGEYKTGFGYEYFQNISYITGWKYEYVYGSFSDLIDMLSEGEIDIMGNVTATDARKEKMDFSTYPEGSETFYVFTKVDRDDLVGAKPEALSGKKIGVGQNTYQSQLMDEYFANLNIDIQKVELDGTKEVVAALEADEIDAAVMTDATDYGYAPVQVIGFHDYYFAVAKGNTDLLNELDVALAQIQSADPNYNVSVARKYSFGSASVNYLTKKEKTWLKEHKNTIHMGYLTNNLPYSDTAEDGTLTGVLKIVVDELKNKFDVEVEVFPYDTLYSAQEAMIKGKIDCMGPAYGDYFLTEQLDLIQSKTLIATTPVLLYNGKMETDTIAVSEHSMFTAPVVQILFPEAEIVEYDSIEDCMTSVAREETDCTLITSATINVMRQYNVMNQLSYTELLQNAELCMLANRGEANLLSILNKAIYLSSTQMKGVAFVTSADSGVELNWKNFIHENGFILFIISLAVIGVLLALLIYIFFIVIKARKAEERANASYQKVLETQQGLENLTQQVTVDVLTGLLNRFSFKKDTEALTDVSQIAIVSIDVNELKEVNDSVGHERGDELLSTVGKLVQDAFSEYGKCYHISGDEFAVIVEKDIDKVGEMVQALKANSEQVQSPFFKVSLSVGYANGTDITEVSFAELHRTADQKMYEDKVAHYRNRVYDRRSNRASDSISRVATNLSEFVPGGYFVYEAQGDEELLYINNEILNIFECDTKEQFMEHVHGGFRGMIHPDDLERVEQEIKNQISNHMDLDYTEYRIVTVKGNIKKVRDFGRYVSRMNGTGIFYVMISEM